VSILNCKAIANPALALQDLLSLCFIESTG